MNYTQQIKLIKEAFDGIPDDLQDGFTDVRSKLYDMNEASERNHRRFGHGSKLTLCDAAKLFTVKYLLDGFKEPDRFTVDDITSIRLEALYGQAYAKHFHDQLKGWAAKYSEPFQHVDYAELMKTSR